MGPVCVTLYDEIISDRRCRGKTQLNRSLAGSVRDAEIILNLNSGFRKQTILRIEGGGGNDADINWLTEQGKRNFPTPVTPIWSAVYAYDLRGGAVETAIKGSKQGLGITKRNKKSFHG